MRTRHLTSVDNPDFISGIHNYCDRWCERCPLTSRCAVYATEAAEPDRDPASRDINNAAFWKRLAAIFQETSELIAEWAEEKGVDLSPSVLAEAQEQNDREHDRAMNHPLARAAGEYATAVDLWFEHDFQRLEVFSDASGSQEFMEPDEDGNDFVEVIRWYQFFIAIKLVRGLLSEVDEDEYLAEDDARDSDGSVKAALIAIDRSLSAWRLLRELRPENAESIQKFLLDLEKLRLGSESEFPRARDFIRLGFDEDVDRLH